MLGFMHRLMMEISPEEKNDKDSKTQDEALEVLNVSEKVIEEKKEDKDIKDPASKKEDADKNSSTDH